MKRLLYYTALGFFLIFTLVTFYLSSSVISIGLELLFVVWINFIASLLYLGATGYR